MTDKEIYHLLVVGIDTVSIAKSATEAGYRIYAADYFGDTDLRHACLGCEAMVKQRKGKSCGRIESKFKPEAFVKMTRSLVQTYDVDGILLSSGLDDFPHVLYELNNLVPILGNPPDVIERVRKKKNFFEELRILGIDHPETAFAQSLDEAEAAADRMGYPVVVKPIRGFGGSGIRAAKNGEEIEAAFLEMTSCDEKLMVQKFIDGIHASISFLATENGSELLTVNEQLLGAPYLFQQEPFGYCGNIVPLRVTDDLLGKCGSITEKIASHFNLNGSNGFDLIISKEGIPYVVEINPRFQGTLECVNRVLGINLVETHVNACLHSSLPTVKGEASIFCTRLILYAPKRVVTPDLDVFREVMDVPLPGTIIEKGEPLCSVLAEGKNRKLSFQEAKNLAESIYAMLSPA